MRAEVEVHRSGQNCLTRHPKPIIIITRLPDYQFGKLLMGMLMRSTSSNTARRIGGDSGATSTTDISTPIRRPMEKHGLNLRELPLHAMMVVVRGREWRPGKSSGSHITFPRNRNIFIPT